MARAGKYIALLGLYLAVVAMAAGALAARQYGSSAYQASAAAAVLIWAAGSASLAIIALARTNAARLNAILLAMLLRMALPLAAMVYVMQTHPPLASAGLRGLIVVHYLAGLALETYLAVRLVAASTVHSNAPVSLPTR